jgi:hypothetical protein
MKAKIEIVNEHGFAVVPDLKLYALANNLSPREAVSKALKDYGKYSDLFLNCGRHGIRISREAYGFEPPEILNFEEEK